MISRISTGVTTPLLAVEIQPTITFNVDTRDSLSGILSVSLLVSSESTAVS